jgi:IS5 family transposase
LGDARSCLDLAVRPAIDKLGLSLLLLAEVNRQLDVRGLIVKRGTSLTRRLSPARSGALPRAAASIRAIPTLGLRAGDRPGRVEADLREFHERSGRGDRPMRGGRPRSARI